MLATFPVRLVRPERAAEVVGPPYDSWTPAARIAHALAHPRSYLHVTRSPEDAPGLGRDELVAGARDALARLLLDDVFAPPRPALLLYELRADEHRQIGIVAELPVAAAGDGRVLGHEAVRRDRLEVLARHLSEVRAWSSPVAMTYRADRRVDDLVAGLVEQRPPALDLNDGLGAAQRVWVIDDPAETSAIIQAFRRRVLYVIDGHHRVAAARAAGVAGMVTVLFPHDQLQLRAFHRVLRPADARRLDGLATDHDAAPAGAPGGDELRTRPGEVIVLGPGSGRRAGGGDVGRLSLPVVDGVEIVDHLDVVRLQRGVLAPVFDVHDPRTDPRLGHVPAAAGVAAARDEAGDDGLAFLLHAMALDDLLAVADAGEVMPPKSTSFEPKARSGLFVRLLDDP